MSVRRYDTIALGLLKKEELEEEEECQIVIFFCFARWVRKLALYSDLIRLEISLRTRWWCLKCVIVYLARDIPAFVMYWINGESGSSLLIESTDSMIIIQWLP